MARPRGDIEPRILHAARGRFLNEGVDGASLRRIADDAGTSIGMVYYYFPTKEELFLAVVEEVYVALLADLEKVLAPALPVEQRLEALYRRLGALTPDELLVGRIMLREALASPARVDKLFQRFQRGHVPLLLALVRDGLAAGLFDTSHPPAQLLVSMMVLAGPAQALLRMVGTRLHLGRPPDGAALARQMMSILLQGVGGRAQGPRAG
jgi:AcrR family transcriptional regulator